VPGGRPKMAAPSLHPDPLPPMECGKKKKLKNLEKNLKN